MGTFANPDADMLGPRTWEGGILTIRRMRLSVRLPRLGTGVYMSSVDDSETADIGTGMGLLGRSRGEMLRSRCPTA